MVSRVFVVGVGMGNPGTLTQEAREVLQASGLIVGSSRLLDALGEYPARKVALVEARAIARELRESEERVASVVLSGDVGFYSGATGLYAHLDEMGADVHAIPGISSLAYLCARLHVPWQDVHVVSAHGRACDVAGAVQVHERTFVLAGGSDPVEALCAQLVERGLGSVNVAVGERLSYADERIVCGTARELAGNAFGRLAVMLVRNDRPLAPAVFSPHLPDDAFERGEVPMTKEEVRELVVCKLQVRPDDVVWDVGAGTGSVSVELARAAFAGQVFAVERREEACALVERNKALHGTTNLRVVVGEAPDALEGLPAPDRVFVGGSAGCLEQIVRVAVGANPRVRLCVAAVTLETLLAAHACVRELGLPNVEVAQVSVAKAQQVGSHSLMRAHNPVFLVTCG